MKYQSLRDDRRPTEEGGAPSPGCIPRWLVRFCLFLLIGFSSRGAESGGWGGDLTNALQKAQADGKPVLIEFSAPWCPYCRQMENKTFKDQQVEGSLQQFERVAVNIDHNASLAAQHGVSGIPAFVILDPQGEEVAKTSGFMEAGLFRQWLTDGVTNLTVSAALQAEFENRSNEITAALSGKDPASRAKGLALALDCCERREKIFRDFGLERLRVIATNETALLLDGLTHPALTARIRVANLLRDKLGDQFNIDPWEKADRREQYVREWKARLAAGTLKEPPAQ
jgi:thioredoxin-related protein